MVSFRLTKEEHERYNKICLALGIRGFSELARVAIDSFIRHPSLILPGSALESRLSEIESCLRILTVEIEKIGNERSPAANRESILRPSPSATDS